MEQPINRFGQAVEEFQHADGCHSCAGQHGGPASAGVEASARVAAIAGLDMNVDKSVTIAPPGAE
jgi:hypothetical protein